VTGWQRTEPWLAWLCTVAAVVGVIGWLSSVATGSGWLSTILLLLSVATAVFGVAWVRRPASLAWWSGVVVLIIVVGPACYAYVTLQGALPHLAAFCTLAAVALAAMIVVRRYDISPVGR